MNFFPDEGYEVAGIKYMKETGMLLSGGGTNW